MNQAELAAEVVSALEDVKGQDIRLLDVHELTTITLSLIHI